ncbi:hypothetical protein [Pedobacter sandarakinus]|uniref:hypothetical protein n=1 Tax=Pedobacter sandarakinus TaxID=353156 RepID=UPI0022464A98|nr:hypothetical protein [Pedobacter sandarakinus]MCX2576385.1 hypothetical protein [Pedobacter sandarakinus]
MDRKILKVKLDALNINPKDYSLDGTLLPMRTILSFSKNQWVTFEYDERGSIHDLKKFDNEDEACEDILSRLIFLVEWRKKYNIK